MMAVAAEGQSPPPNGDDRQAAPDPPAETIDVFDLLRKLRHKEAGAQTESWDYRKPMFAFAPVIGAKPSSGVLFGRGRERGLLSRGSLDDPHLVDGRRA